MSGLLVVRSIVAGGGVELANFGVDGRLELDELGLERLGLLLELVQLGAGALVLLHPLRSGVEGLGNGVHVLTEKERSEAKKKQK